MVVPVDPQLTGAEVRTRPAAASASAVLVPQHLAGSYPADATPAWAIRIDSVRTEVAPTGIGHRPGAGQTASAPRNQHPAAKPADPADALLLFTTGSTGTPKIVPLSDANLAASVTGICSTYRLGSDDGTLLVMIYFLDRFPRTTKGDDDRRALAAALTQQGAPP